MTSDLYHVYVLLISLTGCLIVGWLADIYVGRYQFICSSLRVTWSGNIATNVYYLIDQYFFKFLTAADTSLHVILTILVGLAMAGIIANSMQFGPDQLIDSFSTPVINFCFSTFFSKQVFVLGSWL